MRRGMIGLGAALLLMAPVFARAEYEPTRNSLEQHQVPDWYAGAKFGIMIHWGLYSVPGYAPTGEGDINQVIARRGIEYHFKHNPYAEWYLNSLRIEGSATRKYHDETYGPEVPYEAFAEEFNRESASWDPAAWAELFADSGARYVVLVTKHHDGFALWPSALENPNQKDWRSERDIVGELSAAVKARDLRMGLYYSGALDWSFTPEPIIDFATMYVNGPTSREYAEYVDFQFRELINRYAPSILWNDIGYPPKGDRFGLISDFYNRTPEGAINDRWMQVPVRGRKLLTLWPLPKIMNRVAQWVVASGGLPTTPTALADFTTPEYTTSKKILERKWECVRGIGHSFGYNRIETAADYLSAADAVVMLVDIVSKNGNLLLNVGPRPDGSIPEGQLECLRGIGEWLKINGEAVYGTRPWERAEGKTADGRELRFTQKGNALYVILLGDAPELEIVIKDLAIKPKARIILLETGAELEHEQQGLDLKISLPGPLIKSPAHVLAIRN